MTRVLQIALFSLLAAPALGQAAFPIAIDQRVRVTLSDDTKVVGRVASVTPEGFLVARGDKKTHAVDRRGIRMIEVSRGQGSKAKKYTIRGAIIAGVIGAISLGLQHDTVGEDGSSAGEAAALGAFSGGLFGGLIGGAIGATKSADRWEQVWP